jgi:hypothetical protein
MLRAARAVQRLEHVGNLDHALVAGLKAQHDSHRTRITSVAARSDRLGAAEMADQHKPIDNQGAQIAGGGYSDLLGRKVDDVVTHCSNDVRRTSRLSGFSTSVVSAQIRAPTQPISVQSRKKLSAGTRS